jgi:hypothetical protein
MGLFIGRPTFRPLFLLMGFKFSQVSQKCVKSKDFNCLYSFFTVMLITQTFRPHRQFLLGKPLKLSSARVALEVQTCLNHFFQNKNFGPKNFIIDIFGDFEKPTKIELNVLKFYTKYKKIGQFLGIN